MVIAEDRSDHKLREANPDWNWDYWDAQVEIKCVICHPVLLIVRYIRMWSIKQNISLSRYGRLSSDSA